MVLPSLFSKSPKKSTHHHHHHPVLVARPAPDAASASTAAAAPAPLGTTAPPPEPAKKSAARVRDRDRTALPSRRSSKFRHGDSHPLNLPPEERHRLSLSAIAAMSDAATPQPMDLDSRDHTPAPSSPAAAEEIGRASCRERVSYHV